MNLLHRWYCRSGAWARKLQGAMMPWALEGVELGEDVLEIGSGPGLSTDWLRAKVSRLTSIEIDDRLAASLQQRLGGTNVTVVEGDATDMSFPDASFSTVVCFTMCLPPNCRIGCWQRPFVSCGRAVSSPALTARLT